MATSSADSSAIMEARRISSHCRWCGRSDWTVYADDANGTGFTLPKGSAVNQLSLTALQVVAFSCNNCGTVRLVNKAVIEAWKSAGRPVLP